MQKSSSGSELKYFKSPGKIRSSDYTAVDKNNSQPLPADDRIGLSRPPTRPVAEGHGMEPHDSRSSQSVPPAEPPVRPGPKANTKPKSANKRKR